jgi:hypothetical protein
MAIIDESDGRRRTRAQQSAAAFAESAGLAQSLNKRIGFEMG